MWMSERRPNDGRGEGDAARLLLAAARERFSTAATDLLLPQQARLTEWQRLTAAALLAKLIGSIEDSLRARLSGQFQENEALHAALSSAHVPIALPLLERAGALSDPELGTILIRRVEEHRFFRDNPAPAEDELLVELLRAGNDAVASEAMAVLLARSRRFDQFQEPVIGQAELPAEFQHRLVWLIAAALRQYMIQHHDVQPGAADAAIGGAATALLGDYDEGTGLEACCMRLALLLHHAGAMDDHLLERILTEGFLPLFVASLAVRCALDYAAAWEVLSDPRGHGPALLLRAGGVSRDRTASILLVLNGRGRLFSGAEGDAAAAQLALFDAIDESGARAVLRLWQIDPGYRSAVARLSTRARAAEPA